MVLSSRGTSVWDHGRRQAVDRSCRSSKTTARHRHRAATMSGRRCTDPITVMVRITVIPMAGATGPGVGAGDVAGSAAAYFLTQITRTTDVLASVEVPTAFTPLA